MIVRVVGQNGGGSRVYVHQLNRGLINKGEDVVTYYKDFKPGDPITDSDLTKVKTVYGLNPLYLFFFLVKNRNKIRYVHSHLRNATVIVYVLCLILGLMHVITVHGPIVYGKKSLKDTIIIYLFGKALQHCKLALFISKFTRKNTLDICSVGVRDCFKVVYNGSDKVLSTLKNSEDVFKIVVVGELTERKRPLEIISLGKILKSRLVNHQTIEINIFGEGYLKKELEDRVNLEDLADLIKIRGNVYNVSDIYSGANLHLIFSYDEGFGRVITEAMSCGIPTIAFNSGAFPEIIEAGKTGFLFDSNEECSNLIMSIINKDKGFVFNSEVIKNVFDSKFSSETFERKTLDYLSENKL